MSSINGSTIIQAKKLCKSYDNGPLQVKVLQNIDMAVKSGDFVAIMGPSGSGKSTLLYLIGGLDKPTSGSITVDGKDLSKMNDLASSIMRRRDVGFIFQFYNLVPNLNVEENVLLPILLDGQKIKEGRRRLDDLLGTVGLSHRRKHTPRELSGGEQQRVAIARALINEPAIILADEPTGNLDSNAGKKIMELLHQIHTEKKKTILMVTHSRDSAGYAERIIHVRDGRIWDNHAEGAQK